MQDAKNCKKLLLLYFTKELVNLEHFYHIKKSRVRKLVPFITVNNVLSLYRKWFIEGLLLILWYSAIEHDTMFSCFCSVFRALPV